MTLLNFMPNAIQEEEKPEIIYDENLSELQNEYRDKLQRSKTYTQMCEQKNFGLFQYEFYKKALKVHTHNPNVVYKLASPSIDTGDDICVIREEIGKRRELFTLQLKTGRKTTSGCGRGVDVKKSSKGSERHHLRLYRVEEFDFLVCVDSMNEREDLFIFDRESLVTTPNATHYKQLQTLSPRIMDRHHCDRGGWELLMPELKEVQNYE